MPTKKAKPTEIIPPLSPERIRLDDDDIRIGINLELEMARLNARLTVMRELSQDHAQQMRNKYGAGKEYTLMDWLTGFQRAAKE